MFGLKCVIFFYRGAMRPSLIYIYKHTHKLTHLSISLFDGLRLDDVVDFGANFDAPPDAVAATMAADAAAANLLCDFDAVSM